MQIRKQGSKIEHGLNVEEVVNLKLGQCRRAGRTDRALRSALRYFGKKNAVRGFVDRRHARPGRASAGAPVAADSGVRVRVPRHRALPRHRRAGGWPRRWPGTRYRHDLGWKLVREWAQWKAARDTDSDSDSDSDRASEVGPASGRDPPDSMLEDVDRPWRRTGDRTPSGEWYAHIGIRALYRQSGHRHRHDRQASGHRHRNDGNAYRADIVPFLARYVIFNAGFPYGAAYRHDFGPMMFKSARSYADIVPISA